ARLVDHHGQELRRRGTGKPRARACAHGAYAGRTRSGGSRDVAPAPRADRRGVGQGDTGRRAGARSLSRRDRHGGKGDEMKALTAAILVGTVVALAPQAQAADEPASVKFAFPAPPGSWANRLGITPWIEEAQKQAGGTLEIKFFPGPALGTFN